MSFGKRPNYVAEQDINVPQMEGFIPRMKLLQAINPELDENNTDKYIPGAKPGSIIITSAPVRIIDGKSGIYVAALATRKVFVEYVPRKMGGGYVATYTTKEEMEAKFTEGNDISPCVEFLCNEVTAEGAIVDENFHFVLRFEGGSKMVPARAMLNVIAENGTMIGIVFHVTSVSQKNKQQQSYYNYKVVPATWVTKEAYKVLESLGDMTPLLTGPTSSNELE